MFASMVYMDAGRNVGLGEDPPHETFTDDVGKMFRFGLQEFGRCMSRVFVDLKGGEVRQVGWYFEKRVPYDDGRGTYRRGVWVTLFTHKRPCGCCGRSTWVQADVGGILRKQRVRRRRRRGRALRAAAHTRRDGGTQ